MAKNRRGPKPRIRKSAPTIRQRVEAAAAERESRQPGRIKRTVAVAVKPARRLQLSLRRPAAIISKPLRPVGRVLRRLAPKYLINSWREVKQVVWPNRRETWRLTLAVFIFAIVFGFMVAGVDWSLERIFKKLILK